MNKGLMLRFVKYRDGRYWEGGGWVYTPFGAVRGACAGATPGKDDHVRLLDNWAATALRKGLRKVVVGDKESAVGANGFGHFVPIAGAATPKDYGLGLHPVYIEIIRNISPDRLVWINAAAGTDRPKNPTVAAVKDGATVAILMPARVFK